LKKIGKQSRKNIADMPKVELHLHFEGSVGPDLLARIAAGGHGVAKGEIERLYNFRNFQEFLAAYGRVNELLRSPGDFYQVARALVERLASQHILYAEITYTPLIHTRLGLDHAQIMASIIRGCAERSEENTPRISFIYDTVRQWGSQAALETVELPIADRRAGLRVVGFGVGGNELSVPAFELEEAFRLAHSAGLGRFVHAGEVGGPESVWEAVEILGAERIGHGIAAMRDPMLLCMLRKKGIALDICPTSNVRTGVVESFESHPLPGLISSGVAVTLGSDDPGFFGVWLEDELERSAGTWDWDLGTVIELQKNAVFHSFLNDREKTALAASLKKRIARPEKYMKDGSGQGSGNRQF
jgi:aminodeoxyfutalosine deaminase